MPGTQPVTTLLPPTPPASQAPETGTALLARVTRLIENLLPALGNEDRLSGQARKLLEVLRSPAGDNQVLLTLLAGFNQRVSLAAEEQGKSGRPCSNSCN
ncbi:MAG: hypothetical protein IPK02_00015 [Candidatus Accumulibacter sp.]|uniref:Uncharacterized protein n=1 Tax=Candidatus Accumulibacter affinis TaxID=2954384 RepID=A0A935T7V8_9PROT|nr:hypothetical protein [Candidatus Accumulibacter affinis]